MNIILWIIAGGAIGWASLALLGMNEYRGTLTCIAIGAAGGWLGGNVIAPMLAGPVATASGINFFALTIAALSAVASMTLGNLLYKRFDI